MARLFTVVITRQEATTFSIGKGKPYTYVYYEAEFAGIHFSRASEAHVMKYVRIAAKRIYGPHSQVIFVHK